MIIGIDLGTTNSLACYFDQGETKIILNRLGENLLVEDVAYKCFDYKYNEFGELTIVPEEANIVRRIFDEYLGGKGSYIIAKELQEEKKEETDKKKEKAEASRNVEDYFKQTNGQFSDDRHPFVVPIEQKFGERGLKSREEILFISKAEENGQTVPAMEKNKQHQPQSQSKFEPDNPMTRQEKLEQSRSQYKAAKKGERKEVKKAATRTAVAKMLESKKNEVYSLLQ